MDSKHKPAVSKDLIGKTIFITGGTGFIGSHLVSVLAQSCKVLALSRNKKKIPGAITINGNITDERSMEKGLKQYDVDVVFHVAGQTRSPRDIKGEDIFPTNVYGTHTLLEVCRKQDIKKIVYSSSIEVYGRPQYNPVDELHPKNPEHRYGISKLVGEYYCKEFEKRYGLDTTILRYTYVYGPRLPEYRAIPLFVNNILAGRPIYLHNNGKATMDYVYVTDVVYANLLSATEHGASRQDFNIGSGIEISVEQIARIISDIMRKGVIIPVGGEKRKPVNNSYSIKKACNLLKYRPLYNIFDGLEEYISYRKR